MPVRHPLAWVLLLLASDAAWARKVDLDYHVRLLPQSGQAEVRLTLADGAQVRSLDFDLGREGLYSDFKADGPWLPAADRQRGVWQPAPGKSSLSYKVRLDHKLKNGSYDSRIAANWALFRGDDLVPPARLDQQDGTELVARLSVDLPAGWNSIETAWPRIGKQRFRIDNVSRLFDRPTGWMLAGTVGVRRARLGETEVSVAGPVGQGQRRMDALTLLTFVWPQYQAVFPRNPAKLLLVGAREHLWRGARAAHDSIYLNSASALVSENGSSPLLRELVRVFARINDREGSDWIGEGLAEYYATELLRRAGGISDDRYQALQKRLNKEGKAVTSLRGEQASGATIARAVLLLQALDREIRVHTHNKQSLDDLVRALMRMNSVSTAEFVQLAESVMGRESEVLRTPLLQ
ncbi:hypothetical protein CSV86_017780 [Pseudomonas putida CSV86]|uniref:Uncharacterized protein n=1 Tax=Pseudomonas bharatica CSV86 TaxID=1005395 RepID=L1M055_9PSED|nr:MULTISPECIES: hypothetical protein [Pseudomonas]MDG9881615.1 hypothetical protein [Pseudomonas sp. GD04058]NNJ16917.1 hypothetical protein [Pseudomonas bharatica CSV86]